MKYRQKTWIASALLGTLAQTALAASYPVTTEQQSRAEQVAQKGVALADLAPNAPERHVVKAGDTLWGISSLFLTSPWRWPELWGMNKTQIANPHLIYPGQTLVLVRQDGRALLQVDGAAAPSGDERLAPRVRIADLPDNAIAAIPQHLIEPFLNEAVVLDGDEFAAAPRVVATQEGRVMVSQGETAYVRGLQSKADTYRLFRSGKPLRDPDTGTVLGYESAFVGTADVTRPAGQAQVDGSTLEVPATIRIRHIRQEVGVGDRLAPLPARQYSRYVPHHPDKRLDGRIISVYGDAITAGQNQIVALNRGSADGLSRGHVLSLWRAGRVVKDRTDERNDNLRLPDEAHGTLFVFQTFKRVAYALVISVQEPVSAGDRFSSPQ
ncbi:LysM peptidoglycan-binding domain-containing protein [Inhella gelatinilytica]|uniref:LysM peptidoglycan-binding domain-containing protein n=1 Tax=Inhella gelatinilytica TaxID=2795030 RepID=A0A931IZL9_9BURK|nr:LysM domain-containing protein [Inhella gelatinilytica]MBH9553935.1 LysM peptidoglycan-binding domain-containing protein [Inhella gelatinilytica]